MTPGGRAVTATVASTLACLGAAFLPWLVTGGASRSAFGLARSATALGFFDGPPRKILLGLWYLLPFMVAATWTAGAAGKPLFTATLGVIVGAMSAAAGIVVLVVARPEPGPMAAIAAGAAAIASAAALARQTSSAAERAIR